LRFRSRNLVITLITLNQSAVWTPPCWTPAPSCDNSCSFLIPWKETLMLRPASRALSTLLLASLLHAQEKRPAVSPEDLRKGAGLLLHQFDPNEDPMPLIKRFEGLRVTDVLDAHGSEKTGFIGSNNALNWRSRGMTGVITNGNCRDTDDLIVQKIPVYSKCQGRGTRPGRIEAAAINRPIVVGGFLVRPGDFVVADGDGVVVFPREHLDQVAEIAWNIAKGDKAGRRKLYEKTGMKPDRTVK
ncbi:MAG: hypothetical protein ACUVS7_16800, partial [Bryobacteraceae bacterium]